MLFISFFLFTILVVLGSGCLLLSCWVSEQGTWISWQRSTVIIWSPSCADLALFTPFCVLVPGYHPQAVLIACQVCLNSAVILYRHQGIWFLCSHGFLWCHNIGALNGLCRKTIFHACVCCGIKEPYGIYLQRIFYLDYAEWVKYFKTIVLLKDIFIKCPIRVKISHFIIHIWHQYPTVFPIICTSSTIRAFVLKSCWYFLPIVGTFSFLCIMWYYLFFIIASATLTSCFWTFFSSLLLFSFISTSLILILSIISISPSSALVFITSARFVLPER